MKMAQSYKYLLLAASCLGILGCSSAESGPINLPIPFSGALTPDARVVVSNGSALNGTTSLSALKTQATPGCTEFPVFNANGDLSGVSEFCESSDVTTTSVVGGDRHHFTIPGTVRLFKGEGAIPSVLNCSDSSVDCVSADLDCFEFPHEDPELIPPAGNELRKGACSGLITLGTGDFSRGVNLTTIDYRYVAFASLEDNKKNFSQILEGVWLLRTTEPLTGASFSGTERQILATLFENVESPDEFSLIDINGTDVFVTALFCEGEVQCGEEFDWNNFRIVEPNPDTGVIERSTFFTDISICEGISCVTTLNARFVGDLIPELGEGFFQSSMTSHDPVLCKDVTGEWAVPAGCDPLSEADDNNPANIDLDYRCVLVLDETGTIILQILGGAFVVSTSN